jgi:transcriptional regulator with XRE-family HTH domain
MRIQDAIGEYVHECRTEYGLTLDQIATESRRYGSNWNSSSIKKLEGGQVAATLENMLMIARAINSLTGGDRSLADIFPDDEDMDIGERTVAAGELRKALSGSPVLFEASPGAGTATQMTEAIASSVPEMMRQVSGVIISSLPADDRSEVEAHEPSLAEHRAARKLGVAPSAVAALCWTRYGRFLDDEAAYRAGEGASPQKRGRETRGIVEELDLLLEEAMNSDSYRAMHVTELGLAAKQGDIQSEQEAYEEMP